MSDQSGGNGLGTQAVFQKRQHIFQGVAVFFPPGLPQPLAYDGKKTRFSAQIGYLKGGCGAIHDRFFLLDMCNEPIGRLCNSETSIVSKPCSLIQSRDPKVRMQVLPMLAQDRLLIRLHDAGG